MKTLLLDQNWDLTLDIDGNIAVASDPYSIAQDVASACRTFLGEVFYDTTLGIPYFQTILGKVPSPAQMKAAFVAAALTVPGVKSAVCFLQAVEGRHVTGQVQITLTTGQTLPVAVRVTIAPQAPSTGASGLDFSNPDNSQYLPGLTGF